MQKPNAGQVRVMGYTCTGTSIAIAAFLPNWQFSVLVGVLAIGIGIGMSFLEGGE